MLINERIESEVRSYCRNFPEVFTRAKMAKMYGRDGKEYLDFFCGAGALNYGHNNDKIINAIIEYLQNDGIMHALDMYSQAKEEFIESFYNNILKPRCLDYKMMFCGPTGTNANEAALKLARKVKGRQNIFAFMGSFHGMSLGSLSLTSSLFARNGAGVSLNNVTFMPFPFGYFKELDTIEYIENILRDDHSGIEKPAAIFCETVQAEGGVIVAETEWLKRLRKLCDKHDILLVCDEIQVGCGRTGTYFSFERADIVPDIVTLAKSISGSGLPMSLLLMKPELDCFYPGEHNGTFRGNQLAFVAATAAIEYADKTNLWTKVQEKGEIILNYINENILSLDSKIKHHGIGMIHGIDFREFDNKKTSKLVSMECFKRGLIIETSGRNGCVVKIMPPLIIENEELIQGLEIIREAILKVI